MQKCRQEIKNPESAFYFHTIKIHTKQLFRSRRLNIAQNKADRYIKSKFSKKDFDLIGNINRTKANSIVFLLEGNPDSIRQYRADFARSAQCQR